MSAKFVQNGDTIDYTPEAAVPAGKLVDLGFAVGVAKLPIPAGALGALALVGVYDIDVDAPGAAKTAGTAIYIAADGSLSWNSTGGSQSAPQTRVGYLVADMAATDTVARVRLG